MNISPSGKDYQQTENEAAGSGRHPGRNAAVWITATCTFRVHSRLTFAKKIDFISGMGHSPRRKAGGGPRYLISDLGQFDWQGGRMRLVSVHPGVSLERIRRKTGFELEITPELKETAPPEPEDLRLLREEIDPLGTRKLETLAGAARKTLLREILQREQST